MSSLLTFRVTFSETNVINSEILQQCYDVGMKLNLKPGSVGLIAAVSIGILFSQNPGLQRTVVHKADVSVPGREAVIARIELAPGVKAGRHTHPGDEISYVV